MPSPRSFPKHLTLQIRAYLDAIRHRAVRPGPKRPRRKDGGGELEPVEPPNPKLLYGGAAAALEFDE